MKKIVNYLVLVALLLTLLPVSLAGCSAAQPVKEVPVQKTEVPIQKAVIRLSQGLPEKHYISYQFKEWADLAMKKSNGSIEVQIFPSAQLYKDADVYGAIMTGAIESGLLYSYLDANYVPEAGIWTAWYIFNTTQEICDVGYTSPLRAKIDAEMEKKGIKQLAWIPWHVEDFGFVTNKPVKVPDDMKGLTIRATGPEDVAWLQKWGANPSYLSGAELYMGLQRSVIQGALATVATSVERKLYEVAPYIVLMPMSTQNCPIGINKSFFDKLAPEQQKALVDAAKEVEAKGKAAALKDLDEIMKRAQELGVKIYKPTAEELKLWQAGKAEMRQQVYKDKPQILEAINQIETQLAAYRQKK